MADISKFGNGSMNLCDGAMEISDLSLISTVPNDEYLKNAMIQILGADIKDIFKYKTDKEGGIGVYTLARKLIELGWRKGE